MIIVVDIQYGNQNHFQLTKMNHGPWTQYRFHGVKPLSRRVWLNEAEPFRKYNLKHRMKMIFRTK
jgi:hypothetical protein